MSPHSIALCLFVVVVASSRGARGQDGGTPGEVAPGTPPSVEAPAAPADAGTPLVIEELESFENARPAAEAGAIESFSTPPVQPTVRAFGSAAVEGRLDTRHDSLVDDPRAEHVAELGWRANVGLDAKLSSTVRMYLEARLRWRGVAARSFTEPKAVFDAELREAFVDVYAPWADFRFGSQVVALGANAALAPADVINPSDLRRFVNLGDGAGTDGKIPVPAVRVLADVAGFKLTGVYAPFFTPSRFTLTAQDEGLVQPSVGFQLPLKVSPSIEDDFEQQLLETEKPMLFGDLALSARRELRGWKVGVTWAWVNEKLPQVEIDPELSALLDSQARGLPVNPALALSLQNRFENGETLYRGFYSRDHVLAADLTRLIGPTQLDVDVAWFPKRTFFTEGFQTTRRTAFNWVIGLSPAEDSQLTWAVSYLGYAIRKVGAQERLFLLEPATAEGKARTAWFHAVIGRVGYKLFDDTLEPAVAIGLDPTVGSILFAPQVRYTIREGLRAYLAAELYAGSPLSPFGYFGRNDQVLGAVELDLF